MLAEPVGREAKIEKLRKEIFTCFLPFILKQVGILTQSHITGKGINSLLLDFRNSEEAKKLLDFINDKSGPEEIALKGRISHSQ